MPEPRTIGQVRAELAREREALADDVAVLREESRSLLPYALGAVAAVAVLTKGRGIARALGLLRILR